MFATWMRDLVDADTSSLTLALAGTFTPTPEMYALAERANTLNAELFERVQGVLRPGVVVNDLGLVFELVAAVKVGGRERTIELRRRYLSVILDGLRPGADGELPGPAPSWQELTERWSA